jgi:3-dehydroquinate synthetase
MSREESARRPLWRTGARAAELWQNRYPLYNSAAVRVNGEQTAEEAAREIVGYFMPAMEAEIQAMGRVCRLRTAWPETVSPAAAAVSSHRNIMLLDAALKDDAARWREHGFRVQVMRRRGEALKTCAQAHAVLKMLQEQALARDDFVVARGGGSLTDMGGFCAGIYKRGINLILIATTLLAAADAAVGGKTAINFGRCKNQIGHFYLPQQVFMDVASFARLRRPQLADGLIEAYKTGLIADPQLSGIIEDNLAIMLKGDLPALAWAAGRSMQIKAALVGQDFREERGLRDLLNLGHTFGHAVESLSGYKISHGRAVAAGLAAAVKLSCQKNRLPKTDAMRMLETIARIWAPPPLPPAHLAREVMGQDKKIRNGVLGFIVLPAAGKARLDRRVCMEEVIHAAYNEIAA